MRHARVFVLVRNDPKEKYVRIVVHSVLVLGVLSSTLDHDGIRMDYTRTGREDWLQGGRRYQA
jgi:hypothetical protein